MITEFVRLSFRLFGKLLYRVRVINPENFPLKGPCILVPNHNSLLDAAIVAASEPRMVRFVIYKEVFKNPILGPFLRHLRMIPIAGTRSRKEIEEFYDACANELDRGSVLCIFPEGEMPRSGFMLGFKKGIEAVVKLRDVPIVPMYVDNALGSPFTFKTGNYKMIKPGKSPFRTNITVAFGKPMDKASTASDLRKAIKDLEAEVFCERLNYYPSVFYSAFNKTRWAKNRFRILLLASKIKKLFPELKKAVISSNISKKEELVFSFLLCGIEVSLVDNKQVKKTDHLFIEDNSMFFDQIDIEELDAKPHFTNLVDAFAIFTFFSFSAENYFSLSKNRYVYIDNIKFDIKFFELFHHSLMQILPLTSKDCLLIKFDESPVTEFYFTNILPFFVNCTIVVNDNVDIKRVTHVFSDNPEILNLKHNSEAKFFHIVNQNAHNKLQQKAVEDSINIMKGASNRFFPVFSVNTSDFVGKDIAGKSFVQTCNKSNSYGRLLPGITANISDITNDESNLLKIRGFCSDSLVKESNSEIFDNWIDIGTGYIDKDGFIYLK